MRVYETTNDYQKLLETTEDYEWPWDTMSDYHRLMERLLETMRHYGRQ